MGLNRAFCDLQIARDFRVVTSLEEKINDLLLPAPQSAERFFHVLHLATVQVPPTNLVDRHKALHIWDSVVLPLLASARPIPPLPRK